MKNAGGMQGGVGVSLILFINFWCLDEQAIYYHHSHGLESEWERKDSSSLSQSLPTADHEYQNDDHKDAATERPK